MRVEEGQQKYYKFRKNNELIDLNIIKPLLLFIIDIKFELFYQLCFYKCIVFTQIFIIINRIVKPIIFIMTYYTLTI